MAFRISRALAAQILAEAAASPSREVCGLLFGMPAEEVTRLHPAANVSPRPETMFEIDPSALIAAHKAERSGGPNLIGCYHSHPNGRPRPSPHDRDAAWGGSMLWLIAAGGALHAFLNTEDGKFVPEELVFLP